MPTAVEPILAADLRAVTAGAGSAAFDNRRILTDFPASTTVDAAPPLLFADAIAPAPIPSPK